MSVIAALDIAVNAQTAQFQASMDGAKKKTKQTATEIKEFVTPLNKMTTSLDKAGFGASAFVKSLGPALAVTAGIAALGQAFDMLSQGVQAVATTTTQTISKLDDLSDTAAKLETSASGFSELVGATRIADVGVESLTSGLKIYQRTLGDALGGSKAASEAFERLGLDAGALSQMSLPDQFKAVAQALSQVDGAAARASAGQKLFGRGAADLTPLLKGGAEGVQALMDRAEQLGITLSDMDVANVGRASDALDDVGRVMEGLQNQLAKDLSPAVAELAEAFIAIGPALRDSLTTVLKEVNVELMALIATAKGIESLRKQGAAVAGTTGGSIAKGILSQLPGGSLIPLLEGGNAALELSKNIPVLPGVQKELDAMFDRANGGFDAIPGKAFGLGGAPKAVDAPAIATRRGNLGDGLAGGLFSQVTTTQSALANRLDKIEMKSRIGLAGSVKGIGPGFQDPNAVSAFTAGLGGLNLGGVDIGGIAQPAPRKFADASVGAAGFGSAEAFSAIARAMRGAGEVDPNTKAVKDGNKLLKQIAANTKTQVSVITTL